ncbi:MAG TPA: aldehyde dehydrogenase family protein [Saprospiraceae bacterium]|nr:aldehyde dehydrogenase family protein [Saprospiraceae bacterium]
MNPYTMEHIEDVPSMDKDSAMTLVDQGRVAYHHWRNTTLPLRLMGVQRIGKALQTHRTALAEAITLEMGKPVTQSLAEVDKCVRLCEHYSETAEVYLRSREIIEPDLDAIVEYHPLGVILGIMPWNFPFWQVLRFAIPAIAAGNTVIHKPAPQVPRCARLLQELMDQAFGDLKVFQTAWVDEENVAQMIGHPGLSGVALTGSDRAGRAVASLAGLHLKVCILELGGSDPFIVLEDADLDQAIQAAVQSRMSNNGQTCIAAKRYIVHESCYAAFRSGIVQELKQLHQGDPRSTGVFFSCLSRPDLADQLREQVNDALAKGATLAFGQPDDELGTTRYRPQIMEGLTSDMRMGREEVFGPVASLYPFATLDDALRIAHETRYGLGASIWSASPDRAMELARQVEAGAISINGIVRSDPRVPFGGIKDSGFGRELGEEGIRAFCNIKSIIRHP